MKLFLYCFRAFDEKKYFDEFSQKMNFEYEYTSEYPSIQNVDLAKGFDAVSTTPTDFKEPLLEAFHERGVKYILTRSIGYEHIDLKKAKELGMHVSHVNYDSETVAEYSIMLMMMSLRKMPFIIARAQVQDYSLRGKMGKNISDCTIGVIGAGQIGKKVIQHLNSFGCRILVYDPYAVNGKEEYEVVSLDALYQQSDIITLHAPATEDNYHLLDKKAFCTMKKGVLIINTARGTLIDTDALIEGLEEGYVGGAALDVLEDENNLYYKNRMGDCISNRNLAILRSFPNVILTPHTAFYTENVVRGMAESTVQCMFDMQQGKKNPLIIL